MAITGPETSRIALKRASLRRHSFFDVMLNGFDHDNRVIHNQADREHQSEQRKRVDRKTEYREQHKVPISDTGTAQQGISVARQPCRKINTTIMTSTSASKAS